MMIKVIFFGDDLDAECHQMVAIVPRVGDVVRIETCEDCHPEPAQNADLYKVEHVAWLYTDHGRTSKSGENILELDVEVHVMIKRSDDPYGEGK